MALLPTPFCLVVVLSSPQRPYVITYKRGSLRIQIEGTPHAVQSKLLGRLMHWFSAEFDIWSFVGLAWLSFASINHETYLQLDRPQLFCASTIVEILIIVCSLILLMSGLFQKDTFETYPSVEEHKTWTDMHFRHQHAFLYVLPFVSPWRTYQSPTYRLGISGTRQPCLHKDCQQKLQNTTCKKERAVNDTLYEHM